MASPNNNNNNNNEDFDLNNNDSVVDADEDLLDGDTEPSDVLIDVQDSTPSEDFSDADNSSRSSSDGQNSTRNGSRLMTGSVIRDAADNSKEKAVFDMLHPTEEVIFDIAPDFDGLASAVDNKSKAKNKNEDAAAIPDNFPTPAQIQSRSIPMGQDAPDIQDLQDIQLADDLANNKSDKKDQEPKKDLSKPTSTSTPHGVVPPLPHGSNTKKQALMLLLCGAVFLAAIVAVFLTVGFGNGDSQSTANSQPTKTVTITTTKPEGFDDAILPTQRQQFVELMVSAGISDSRDFYSLDTPQGKAASQIIYVDADAQEDIGEVPFVGVSTDANFMNYMARYVMLVLYHSTGGDNWNNDQNYSNPNAPVCQWYGVECTSNQITSIQLAGNNLVGMLPEQEMKYLLTAGITGVTTFDVSNNALLRGDLSPACNRRQDTDALNFMWKSDSCNATPTPSLIACDCCEC